MKQRLIWADSLKGFLIVLVVLGHAIQGTLKEECFTNHVWNYIYSFHMAAFMAVSGYLSFRGDGEAGGANRWRIVFRRFSQLIIPFLIWSMIEVVAYRHCSLDDFLNIFLYPDGYFWFLWVLFFIAVFFQAGGWLAEKLRVKKEFVIMGLCFFFCGLMVIVDIRVLGYQFFAYYFLFYTIGYYLHKYDNYVTTKVWVLLLLTVVWSAMSYFWNMHELPVFLKDLPLPQTIMQYAYRFFTALIAIYVLLGVSPKLLNSNARWNKALVELGKLSLGIYVVHILLIPVIEKEINNFVTDKDAIIILTFILSLGFAWIVVRLLSKWKCTNRFLLGKI